MTPNFFIVGLAVLLPHLVQAQQSPSLVGTWRLVSYVIPDSNGRVTNVWGDRPLGLIIYQPDGTMAAQGFDERRPSFGQAVAERDSTSVRANAYAGLWAYYGRYTLDPARKEVTHHVEGAWNTDWIRASVVRAYRFIDVDHVELTVVRQPDGRVVTNGAVLTWERVRR